MAWSKDPTAPLVYFLFIVSECQPGRLQDDVPVCRCCSGDSLVIGDDGFVKVLLAEHTGFLVSLDGVGPEILAPMIDERYGCGHSRDTLDIDVTTNVSRQVAFAHQYARQHLGGERTYRCGWPAR